MKSDEAPLFDNRGYDRSEELQAHIHRRASDPEAMVHLHARVSSCEASINRFRQDMKEFREYYEAQEAQFAQINMHISRMVEIMEAWNSAKGFWTVLRFMSASAKAAMYLAGIAAAVWIFFRTGHWIKLDE